MHLRRLSKDELRHAVLCLGVGSKDLLKRRSVDGILCGYCRTRESVGLWGGRSCIENGAPRLRELLLVAASADVHEVSPRLVIEEVIVKGGDLKAAVEGR